MSQVYAFPCAWYMRLNTTWVALTGFTATLHLHGLVTVTNHYQWKSFIVRHGKEFTIENHVIILQYLYSPVIPLAKVYNLKVGQFSN